MFQRLITSFTKQHKNIALAEEFNIMKKYFVCYLLKIINKKSYKRVAEMLSETITHDGGTILGILSYFLRIKKDREQYLDSSVNDSRQFQ